MSDDANTAAVGLRAPARPDLAAVAAQMAEALEGVIAVADRRTVEFDVARAALSSYRALTATEEA